MQCFLALTRLSNGDAGEAVAILLDVILDSSSSADIERYCRALASYRDELRGINEA